MPGKTIIITGASDGIGAAAARQLAKDGEKVVLVGRSPQKTEAIARQIGADHFLADFSDLAQVRALAERLGNDYKTIDVLANNAGGIMGARQLTVDGYEKTFQVNHLAPFLLTTLLIDKLCESTATVIATSSAANLVFGHIDIDDLQNEKKYSPNKAYGDAKLANILFSSELDHRYRDRGISAASFHPGVIATNFASESSSMMRVMYRTGLRRFLGTPETGADTLVWLASSTPLADWPRGEYFAKRRVLKANLQAHDAALGVALWDKSRALVGVDAN